MELILNLGWSLLALGMVCAWMRFAPRGADNRRAQAVTLAVAILILLPAISMTDDLAAAQNPAEVVSTVRRDHDDSGQDSVVPAAALPVPIFAALSVAVLHVMVRSNLSTPIVDRITLAWIQNRPPPAA